MGMETTFLSPEIQCSEDDKGLVGLWRVSLDDGHKAPMYSSHLRETLNNIFDLPSTEQTICYLHACAGFPMRRTWVKAVRRGKICKLANVHCGKYQQVFSRVIGGCEGPPEPLKAGHVVHKKRLCMSTKLWTQAVKLARKSKTFMRRSLVSEMKKEPSTLTKQGSYQPPQEVATGTPS